MINQELSINMYRIEPQMNLLRFTHFVLMELVTSSSSSDEDELIMHLVHEKKSKPRIKLMRTPHE